MVGGWQHCVTRGTFRVRKLAILPPFSRSSLSFSPLVGEGNKVERSEGFWFTTAVAGVYVIEALEPFV